MDCKIFTSATWKMSKYLQEVLEELKKKPPQKGFSSQHFFLSQTIFENDADILVLGPFQLFTVA